MSFLGAVAGDPIAFFAFLAFAAIVAGALWYLAFPDEGGE